jgi:hypothetical protein
MAVKTVVRLTSCSMVNTAGLLRWAMNGYKFKKDRKSLRRVFAEGYGLTDDVAHRLLLGEIPHTIEGDEVVFEVEGRYKRRATVVS